MSRTPHIRYVRHRSFDRLQHSEQFLQWMDAQADRLESTPKDVFEILMVQMGMTAQQVEALGEIPPQPSVPVLTISTINGDAIVGETLSITATATGQPEPDITYQWLSGEDEIDGATASSYVLVEADEGAEISCRVTATNNEGSDTKSSDTVGPVEAAGSEDPIE